MVFSTHPAMAPEATLPTDPRVLQQLVLELREQLAKALREKAGLEFEVQRLGRQLFGRRSERIDPNQLTLPELTALLEALGSSPPPVEEEIEEKQPAPAPRRRKRRKRARFDDLPLERIEHGLSEEDRHCPCCGDERRIIRFETSIQLEYRPGSFVRLEHARAVGVCDHAMCDDAPVIAPKPEQPIDKGLPGPGLLAHLAVSKFADHAPLNRLSRIWRRHGVEVPRSTLVDWVGAIAARAGPLVEYLRQDLLRSRIVATDDTSVPVLEPRQKTTKKGRLWVYVGDDDHPWTLFDYSATREGIHPERYLTGFEGHLQADAYSGYDRLYADGKVLEVGCWMHCRRYFHEAAQADPSRPCEALAFIRELYRIEREAKDLSADERQAARDKLARPILEAFEKWILRELASTLPKSPLGKALGYTSRQWKALTRYLEHGDIPIDNGRSERALRGVAVGRRNWTFAGSDVGGERAATLYSIVATCQRHGIDSFAYFRDFLRRIPGLPESRIGELTPLAWKVEQTADSDAASDSMAVAVAAR